MTAQSETGALLRVAVKHVRDAWGSAASIDAQWHDLAYTARPDADLAGRQHDRFVQLLEAAGATVHRLPPADGTGLDSIYVRDAAVVSDLGAVLCRMGKPQRRHEPEALADACRMLGIAVAGNIASPGCLEGGDVVWLGRRTLAVGSGYRTNPEGIGQLRALLAPCLDELVEVPLPHWQGPGEVLHLMSLISPVDVDLAVVYSRLLPVPFRRWLLDRGIALIEVPDEEFDTMGTNVLALGPRRCLMVAGNPGTRTALEAAGATVAEYDGSEISAKGAGGPTCLTRPLTRA